MNKITYGFTIAILVIFSLPITVLAEDTATQNTVDTTIKKIENPTLTAEEKEAKRLERIEAYKNKMAEKITQNIQNRIVARCSSAQTKLTAIDEKTIMALEKRATKYTEIIEKLNGLAGKLQAGGVDTTTLQTAIGKVETQMNLQITESGDLYSTALTDIAGMDCESDPEGFKAALDSARGSRAELAKQSSEIRNTLKDEIKPILQDIRSKLADENTEV